MKKERLINIIAILLFAFFSFFSFFSYKMLLIKQKQMDNYQCQQKKKKINEMTITLNPKKTVLYNKKNHIRFNYFYYETNIIIPGNDMASTHMQKKLKEETLLDHDVLKELEPLQLTDKEYILEHDIEILYSNNKIISFAYHLLGTIENKSMNELKVFSLNRHTGIKLKYKDISLNEKYMKYRIKNTIIREIKQNYQEQKNFSKSALQNEIDKENFYLGEDDLTVVVNRCLFLDCHYGNLFIKIPYKNLKDLLKDQYD